MDTNTDYAELHKYLDRHGFVHRLQLDELGVGIKQIARMTRTGALHKIKPSIYVDGGHPQQILDAHQHGGRLTCWKLLVALGAWAPPVTSVQHHFALAKGQHKPQGNAIWHRSKIAGFQIYEPLTHAVSHLVDCLGSTNQAWAVGVLDSALRKRIISRADLHLAKQKGAGRDLTLHLHSGTNSMLETVLAVHLNNAKVQYKTQVAIGRYTASFLVDNQVVVDVIEDGSAKRANYYHADTAGKLAVLGYQYVEAPRDEILHSPARVLSRVKHVLNGRRSAA